MKAMIFAAGLGTRLRPLTNNLPKALVPYKGKPLLQIVIENLKIYGFDTLIINVHHFADKIIEFLEKNDYFNTKIIISDERNKLMDTGGGLYFARKYFDDDFLIHNVDIISDINLKKLADFHKKYSPLATLAVQDRESNKKLYFDTRNNLCKWKNEVTGEEKIARNCDKSVGFAFSGIHFVSPRIFKYMSEGVYSIIDTYLKAAENEEIKYFDHTGDSWRDMGKPESFSD